MPFLLNSRAQGVSGKNEQTSQRPWRRAPRAAGPSAKLHRLHGLEAGPVFALSKGLQDAQSFLGYVLSTKLSYSLQHHVHIRHPSQGELWWTEGRPGLPIKRDRASTRKYLRGLREIMFKCCLQSRAAYINFQHNFVRLTYKGCLQSRAANNRINTVCSAQKLVEQICDKYDRVKTFVCNLCYLLQHNTSPTFCLKSCLLMVKTLFR